jgi:hypothetical protein
VRVHIAIYSKDDEDDDDKWVDCLDGEGKSFIEAAKNAIEGDQMGAQKRRCHGHTGIGFDRLESDYCSKCGGYIGPD